jgi:hypothetical protein
MAVKAARTVLPARRKSPKGGFGENGNHVGTECSGKTEFEGGCQSASASVREVRPHRESVPAGRRACHLTRNTGARSQNSKK